MSSEPVTEADNVLIEPTKREVLGIRRHREAVKAFEAAVRDHGIQSVQTHDAQFDMDWWYADFILEHATRYDNTEVAAYLHWMLTMYLFGTYDCCEEPYGYSHDASCEGHVCDDCSEEE